MVRSRLAESGSGASARIPAWTCAWSAGRPCVRCANGRSVLSATCVGPARLTNGIGIGMHHQGALVVTVHASFIDTDMAALVDARPQAARSRSPSRPSTASRPARSRYSPTSGPGSSRRRCHAITS
jgi:hypothetical protein